MKKSPLAFLACFAIVFCCLGGSNKIKVGAEAEKTVNVYSVTTGLTAAPTVITEYSDGMDITELEQKASSSLVRPSAMIVQTDEDFNVTHGGVKVGYDQFRLKYIKSKMLPAVRVETDGAADALITYLSDAEHDFIDFSVVSSDPALVKKVRDARPSIRGIIDYSSADLSLKTAGKIASEANENKALTVILNYAQAAEKTEGIQAMFKSVWVKQTVEDEYDVLKAVSTGAMGILTDNYKKAYEAYQKVEEPTLSRPFYNIAHRGLKTAGENTLESLIAAYEAGATHFEIDAKVCKSGEIVLMHDDGISTTTNGSGSVYDMTLAELRQYKVVKNSDGTSVGPYEIPTLEDVFKYFKGKDAVMIVEIKNAQKEYPAKFAELVKKYDIADQVCAIGFGISEIAALQQAAPGVPAANLNGTTYSDLLIYMAQLSGINAAADPSKSGFMTDSKLFKNFTARGYVPYCWTFGTAAEAKGAVARGIAGITTDSAEALGGYVKKVLTNSVELKDQADLDGDIMINVKTHAGEETTRIAKILTRKEVGNNAYNAVLYYYDNDVVRLTGETTITIKGSEKPADSENSGTSAGNPSDSQTSSGGAPAKKGGCSGGINGATAALALLPAIAICFAVKVKKC